LFNRRLRTCGTPGITWEDPELENKPSNYGCWCYMPLKVHFSKAECWAWEKSGGDIEFGWEELLNGRYQDGD
jgi:hypothetical protein